MIDSGKIVRFSVFIASAAFLYANADQSAENQIDIVPEWGLASLNMPQDDFMKNNPGFKTIMKGKNVNSALAIKNRPDDFWDIALCYINQNKVEAITFAITNRKNDAREKSIAVLNRLLRMYGSNFELAIAELDSTITKNTSGYSFFWKGGCGRNIILIIGPFDNPRESQFQLSLTLFAESEKSPFCPRKFEKGKNKDMIMKKMLDHYRDCYPRSAKLLYIESILKMTM